MSGRLAGRQAIVTGAARGLGRAVADALQNEGASVYRWDREEADLSDTKAVLAHVETLRRRFPSLDVLVNNAGVLRRAPLGSVSDGAWSETLAVNLTAPFLLMRELLDALRAEGGGSVINISSRAGIHGFAEQAAYCASKFGIEGLTRAAAFDLANAPVSVNTVTPGLRIKPTMMTDQEEAEVSAEERVWHDPARLAPAFVYLALARGRPTGRRFDALRLSERIEREGYDLSDESLKEITE